MKIPQSLLAVLCVFLLSTPRGFAQNAGGPRPRSVVHQDTSRWYSPFTKRYTPPDVEPINLGNSARIESLIRAGRIYLSLQDAIALALENNIDIEVQRYGPRIAEANLLRAQAGGLIRGLTQTVQAGPSSALNQLSGGGGGGVPGSNLAGGGAGGAGSGGGTIILSTGTQIPNLDESLFLNYNWGHNTNPNSNSFATGIAASVFESGNTQFGIRKEFLMGTTVQLGYGAQRIASNNVRSEINPVRTANVDLQFTQPLLRGFGMAVNSRNINKARNNIEISNLLFREQIIATVSSIINLYFDLVSIGEDVKVKRQALSLNEKLFSDNKKQVEIGTLAPIAIVQAEAEVARSQQELTNSETQLLLQETIIKNALSRTGLSSPTLADARIVPTDQLRIPDVEPVTPIQDLVALAIQKRPELVQTQLNIENSRLDLLGSKSQLRPALNLVAATTNNGLAGQTNTIPVALDPTGVPFQRNANPAFLGGYGTVLSQLFSRNYPDYSVGFQLIVPLRNRAALADVVNDQLSIRQGELRQRREINQIRVDVQNAVIGLQQARARHQAAQKARFLQEQTLDAEQKKYALGASTIFFVIQFQRDLAQAQSAEVAALSAYNRARVQLETATGQVIEAYGISIEEAVRGEVTRPPSTLPEIGQQLR